MDRYNQVYASFPCGPVMTPAPQSVIPASQTEKTAAELDALLRGAGISPLRHSGWIRVTGEDRARWLNGMVTNSVQHLAPGEGAYNFFLNAQGRIQGDGTIFAEPTAHDTLWIETARTQVAGMMTTLDHFIIMDDVELADVSNEWSGLLIVGPLAASLMNKIGIETSTPNPPAMHTARWNQAEIHVIDAYGPLVPRVEIWVHRPGNATLSAISNALLSAGAVACEAESFEWLRMLEGTPLYGTDIRDRELPQETGQERALHFSKGCYLGQEIVERIRSRGNVHRTFRGFRLEGEMPGRGAILEADGKSVGELTSVAAISLSALSAPSAISPEGSGAAVQLALGYVRREAVEREQPLVYQGGMAIPILLPASLSSFAAAASHQSPASELSERA